MTEQTKETPEQLATRLLRRDTTGLIKAHQKLRKRLLMHGRRLSADQLVKMGERLNAEQTRTFTTINAFEPEEDAT